MKILTLAIVAAGLVGIPGTSMAAQAVDRVQVAQVDVQVGPNGVRVGRDRDRDRFEERRFERRRERVYVEPRGPRCRTIIERRETRYGTETRRIRRCG